MPPAPHPAPPRAAHCRKTPPGPRPDTPHRAAVPLHPCAVECSGNPVLPPKVPPAKATAPPAPPADRPLRAYRTTVPPSSRHIPAGDTLAARHKTHPTGHTAPAFPHRRALERPAPYILPADTTATPPAPHPSGRSKAPRASLRQRTPPRPRPALPPSPCPGTCSLWKNTGISPLPPSAVPQNPTAPRATLGTEAPRRPSPQKTPLWHIAA